MSTQCRNCEKHILTDKEHENLELHITADQQFDGGEFSGSFDYYSDICMCCHHDINPRNKHCGECDLEDRLAWEEEMRSGKDELL